MRSPGKLIEYSIGTPRQILYDSGFRLAEQVPIAKRFSICTPTIQFKMALYIDEAVSPAVSFFDKVAMKNRYQGSERLNISVVV